MSVFSYIDCREFLRERLRTLPKQGRGELAKIARHLNVNPTLISQIMSKARSFSPEQGLLLAEYFGLSDLERDYFLLMVQEEQASTHQLKELFREKREGLRTQALQVREQVRLERSLTEEERVRFYSSWSYSAVHLYCSVDPKGVTVEDVVGRFRMQRARVLEVLRFLVDVGLCEEKLGRYLMSTQSTFVEKGSPHLKRHHLNWRVKAMERQEDLEDTELMFTAQVSLSRADFEKLREMAMNFIKQAAEVVKDSPAEDVANLNLDFFWVK